jgi:type VI protein secretion system component Hcp
MDYDISQRTSMEAGSGMISGGANFSPVQITKVMDKSTPQLFFHLCAGIPITRMTIRVSRPGAAAAASSPNGGLFEAETYDLQNIIVASYHTSGAPGAGSLPLETWSFACTAISETYRTVDAKGNLQAAQKAAYDLAHNVAA